MRRRNTGGGFLYSLDPAERERLEKEEAARLKAKRDAEAAEAAERKRKEEEKETEELEKRMRAAAVKEAHSEGGIGWLFSAGIVTKVPAASLPPHAGAGRGRGRGPGGRGSGVGSETYIEVWCELPSLLVGRIIGKAGATIKEITARSGARVSIDSGAPGMSVLTAAGRPEALESARALINNALAPKPR